MKVSIVIPTYNRADLIGETLASVYAQSYTDWEAIVVDDGSADDTESFMWQVAAEHPQVRYHRQVNSGAQVARNKGLELSKGDLVMFLDSDDLLHPEKLTRQVAAFQEDPALDVAFCQTAWFREKPGDEPFVWNRITLDDPFGSFLAQDILWSTPAGLWRRSFVEQMGGWRLGVKSSQDVDFHLRAAYEGHRMTFLPETLVFARQHAGPRVSGISRAGWIQDVVDITDYIRDRMACDGRLDERYAHEIASNFLWCARKEARDASLERSQEYLQKAIDVEPNARVRAIMRTSGPPTLRMIHKFKRWYYGAYALHLVAGIEVRRYNWFMHYSSANWLAASRL